MNRGTCGKASGWILTPSSAKAVCGEKKIKEMLKFTPYGTITVHQDTLELWNSLGARLWDETIPPLNT